MKSLYNKYQAFDDSDEDMKVLNRAVLKFVYDTMDELVDKGYQPTEIAGYLHSMVEYAASEKRLRTGFALRKKEREDG